MRIIKTKVYKIGEHPNKERCYEWIRNNQHDLNQHGIDELVETIEELSKKIGGSNKYSISQFPDRSEHISFSNYNDTLLHQLNTDDCPLTGVFWDIEVINALKENDLNRVLNLLHNETESIYSDEGLFEMCDANDYEFTEDGERI